MKLKAILIGLMLLSGACTTDTTSIGHPCEYILFFRKPDANIQLNLAQTATLAVTTEWPTGCHTKHVVWRIDPYNLARIDGISDTSAVVTALAPGTATATATLREFPLIKTQFTVNIPAVIPPGR